MKKLFDEERNKYMTIAMYGNVTLNIKLVDFRVTSSSPSRSSLTDHCWSMDLSKH